MCCVQGCRPPLSAHSGDKDIGHNSVDTEAATHVTCRKMVGIDHTSPFVALRRLDVHAQLASPSSTSRATAAWEHLIRRCRRTWKTERERISKIGARLSTRNWNSYNSIRGSERREWSARPASVFPKSGRTCRHPPGWLLGSRLGDGAGPADTVKSPGASVLATAPAPPPGFIP